MLATTEKKIPRRELGMEALRLVRESLQERGCTEGKTLTFTELERESMLLAQLVTCEVIEAQFEELVAKRSRTIEKAIEAFAGELGTAFKSLTRRVEELEKAAQK